MVAAVSSMLMPCLRHTSNVIVIVRMVSSSSSSIPASLQHNATAAWSRAKIWMIQDVFICFIGLILLQIDLEDMKIALKLQFLSVVRREKRTVHHELFTVRQAYFSPIIYNDYFSRLL